MKKFFIKLSLWIVGAIIVGIIVIAALPQIFIGLLSLVGLLVFVTLISVFVALLRKL